jgi:acyl carrier protein
VLASRTKQETAVTELEKPLGPRSRRSQVSAHTIEAALALCASVLDLPSIDASDNFLDLGGDSFSAIELSAQLTKLCGFEVTVDDVFVAETFAELFLEGL